MNTLVFTHVICDRKIEIVRSPLLSSSHDQRAIELCYLNIFQQNWLWVMLIDLAMSNIELHFGELMITANQNEDLSYNSYPTKEIARMLATCLNR